MEVNLAIMVMATGLLAIVSLYSFGYRENRQGRDDVASTVYADAVISPLVMALSATNLKWSVFRSIQSYPSDNGWGDYIDSQGRVKGDPEAKAISAFNAVMSKVGSTAKVATGWPSTAAGNLKAGLVIIHDEDSPIVSICFRACKRGSELLSMPAFYTDVRFQGDPDK